MELLISGVSVKLSADEIISALLSDEGKGLLELKRKLDEIESQIAEVEFEEPKESKLTFHPPKYRQRDSILTGSDKIVFTKTPEGIIDGSKITFFEHDEMGMFPTQIMPDIKDLLQSDTELQPTQKECLKSNKTGSFSIKDIEDMNKILINSKYQKITPKHRSVDNPPSTLKKRLKSNKKHVKRKRTIINPVTGKRRYHPRKKRDIANNAEKRKFETNAPGKITGKNYRTAENNPFL